MQKFTALFVGFVLVLSPSLGSSSSNLEILPFQEALYPQVQGKATRGKLLNSVELPSQGPGYLARNTWRNRHWGTVELVSIIQSVGEFYNSRYPQAEPISVGDMSRKGGGRASRHRSHQTGMDVDIAYLRKRMPASVQEGGPDFGEVFVQKKVLSENFDPERTWSVLVLLFSSGMVNRVFVDLAVKESLCDFTKAHAQDPLRNDILRRIRPSKKHRDHFHVRLYCPKYSPKCRDQVEPGAGSGCQDSTLEDEEYTN